MSELSKRPSGATVVCVEDADIEIRVYRRGFREPCDNCALSISLAGEERLTFDEEAGPEAPGQLIVDLRTSDRLAETLVAALRSAPWHHIDQPVIMFGTDQTGPGRIGYLVRTPKIRDLLETIRAALDRDDPRPGPAFLQVRHQTRLDLVTGGG